MISEAEAFVRHNAHDCLAPHHEKDYRALQLFAPAFMTGRTLVALRISSEGTLELNILQGTGVITSWGMVVIHKGHPPPTWNTHHRAPRALSALSKVARDIEAHGWASFLERGEGVGVPMVSKQHPCYRCRQPQTPCRAGEGDPVADRPDWDPADVPDLPYTTRLQDRPSFKHGLIGQEVFAGWAGWTAGLRHQGFKRVPVELYADPLRTQDPQPEHDLTKAPVIKRLRDLAAAAPAPGVPNVWQFGSPCTTYCDFQLLNGGTRTHARPEGDGSRPDELLGNQFADLSASLCESLFEHGREFAFESSAPSGRYPKIWDMPSMRRLRKRTGARIVAMDMCAWYLGAEEGTPGHFHRKRTCQARYRPNGTRSQTQPPASAPSKQGGGRRGCEAFVWSAMTARYRCRSCRAPIPHAIGGLRNTQGPSTRSP